jgi:dUTP pyrophosphatase
MVDTKDLKSFDASHGGSTPPLGTSFFTSLRVTRMTGTIVQTLNSTQIHMKLKVKRIHQDAQLPKQMSKGAAGYDICSIEEVIIKPGETAFIASGIAIEIPEGYWGLLAPRGSLAMKKHIVMPHSFGVIDSDYRGEYMTPLRNLGSEAVTIEKGERIAQLIILKHESPDIEEVDDLSDTERGAGRFGSTGKI